MLDIILILVSTDGRYDSVGFVFDLVKTSAKKIPVLMDHWTYDGAYDDRHDGGRDGVFIGMEWPA